MTLLGRVRTTLSLPPRRWLDLALAVTSAARIERALHRGGLERASRIAGVTVRMDGEAAPVGAASSVEFTTREREQLDTAWRVLRHPPFNGTCLRRALVGGRFLRDRSPIVRIGVTKIAGVVAAHAWLEVDGVGLDPDGATKYAPLAPVKKEH
jgi:hypothetical protein